MRIAQRLADDSIDQLAVSCENGNMMDCDNLFLASDLLSPLWDYGDTCGQRVADSEGMLCTVLFP